MQGSCSRPCREQAGLAVQLGRFTAEMEMRWAEVDERATQQEAAQRP